MDVQHSDSLKGISFSSRITRVMVIEEWLESTLVEFQLRLTQINEATMANIQITLSDEERQCVASLLETVLKEKQIEEHRTRTPSYRELIQHQEALIQQVLNKLRQTQG
jgi:hypothetical protein